MRKGINQEYVIPRMKHAQRQKNLFLLENGLLLLKSNTTGEKDFEEFFTENEILDVKR